MQDNLREQLIRQILQREIVGNARFPTQEKNGMKAYINARLKCVQTVSFIFPERENIPRHS